MSLHIAHREFTVSDGNAILCAGEVRYTFTAIATGTALLLTAPVHAGGPVIIKQPETAPGGC